jgi:hypothetical protein
MCARIVHLGRKLSKENGADHVCETHSKITTHYEFTTAYFIDDHHEEEFTDKAND